MLLETIKIKNKTAQNLPFHQARFDKSRSDLWGLKNYIDLAQYLKFPTDDGIYKCRILYKKDIEKVELVPYTIRPVRSLRLVMADELVYDYKYADRSALADLVAQKGKADEVLIIKNGWVTDTSYSNIVFWDGNVWWTPDTPLLKGTRRAKYLSEGRIKTRAIPVKDLKLYEGAKLINAMVGLEDTELIKIANIKKADNQI